VIIYRGIPNLHQEKGIDDSESCHVNINCSPEGDGWKTTKRGVAKLYFREGSSWYVCSGTLVNNAKNDGKPYFLTADHCGGTASINDRSVWQFHFNFERPSCDNNSTPTYNVLTGCTLKARGPLSGGSDFQLLELSSIPPLSWFPYYNGWDRNTNGATSGVSIHHPQGDIKKISTYTESLTSSTPTIDGLRMADNSAWRVYWKATTNGHGVTEGGSSGSPIFNANRQVVGTLSGGGASCSSLTSPDYYGKFSYHWASNGTTNPNKLQPWLDPDNSNITSLNGYDPNGTLYANFEANKTSANTGEQITFTDISTGTSITSWAWTFGEGATPVTATGKGPHTVTYSTGGLKTVSLTINGTTTTTKQGFINILDVPSNTVLYEGFEGAIFPPTGWLNVDSDGDSHKWFAYGAEASAHSGFKCTGSASWDEDTEKALTPNNWLITPQIDITHNNFILEYWVGAQDNDWPKEKYGVFVSKTNTSTTSFVQVFSETLSNDVWNKRQIDLSSYVGEKIYIAFCHFDCTDMFILKIDDVLVTGGATNNSNILDDTAYQIFPNPFGNTLTFKNTSNVNTILIKNVIGSTVKIIKPNGCDEVEVTTSALSSGLYFVVMELHNHERLVKKIIKH
jgi:PKD repeat protein